MAMERDDRRRIIRQWNREIEDETRRFAARDNGAGPWKAVVWTGLWFLWLGALVGAIAWNVASWLLAFPTSSSHALIGGLLGAGIAHAGLSAVVWSGVIKTAFGIVLAPLSGFAVAVALVIAASWMSARSLPFAVDRRFRHLQLVSAAL